MIEQHRKVSEVVTNRTTLPDGRIEEVVLALCETPDRQEAFAGTVWCSVHGETRIKEPDASTN